MCKEGKPQHIDLLFLKKGVSENGYYIYMKHFSHLVSPDRTKHNGRTHTCKCCLSSYQKLECLEQHQELCDGQQVEKPVRVQLPQMFENILWFKDQQYSRKLYYVISSRKVPFLAHLWLFCQKSTLCQSSVHYQRTCDFPVKSQPSVKVLSIPSAVVKVLSISSAPVTFLSKTDFCQNPVRTNFCQTPVKIDLLSNSCQRLTSVKIQSKPTSVKIQSKPTSVKVLSIPSTAVTFQSKLNTCKTPVKINSL